VFATQQEIKCASLAHLRLRCPHEEARSRPAQAGKSIFVGYEDGAKAYRVYDLIGHRMYVTHNLSFEEHHAGNYDVVWGRNTTFSS
jgi:hypothetical protein